MQRMLTAGRCRCLLLLLLLLRPSTSPAAKKERKKTDMRGSLCHLSDCVEVNSC